MNGISGICWKAEIGHELGSLLVLGNVYLVPSCKSLEIFHEAVKRKFYASKMYTFDSFPSTLLLDAIV